MTAPVPTRDGATVMLVRDGAHRTGSIEVFMLRRHPRTAFGSVHVFPGGVVDEADSAAELQSVCPGLTDASASAQLGLPSGGRAFWVAALREAFEEAGVLLARAPDGAELRVDHDSSLCARLEVHRRALHARSRSLLEVLQAEHLLLGVEDVRYVSHWITPVGEPKRFDTRFFLARAPEHQSYAHDGHELIGSEWVRPADALDRHRAGDFALIGPTIRSLQHLAAFSTCDALLDAHPAPVAAADVGAA